MKTNVVKSETDQKSLSPPATTIPHFSSFVAETRKIVVKITE